MNAKLLLATLGAALAACNVVENPRLSDDGSVTIAPRLQTASGVELPVTDSVYVKVSSEAKVWYEKTLSWSSKFVVISGIPRGTGFTVVMEGREAVAGGTSAVWWRGSQSATAGAAVNVEAQSLTVPVTVSHASIPWNDSIAYGTLRDARDGQVYRTVVIGGREWMAENLNYRPANVDSGWCYESLASNCSIYGRLYAWSQVMQGAGTSVTVPSGVRGVCPEGWHVPSGPEWGAMVSSIGGNYGGGAKLKAKLGWDANGNLTGNGSDAVGFRALPAGDVPNSGVAVGALTGSYGALLGSHGSWWTTSSSYHLVNTSSDIDEVANGRRTDGLSARCVKDDPIDPNTPMPTNGLIAWYPFEGNATDASGSGHSGVLSSGVTPTTDRFGVAGKAVTFSGLVDSSVITIADASDLNPSFLGLSFWIRPLSGSRPTDSSDVEGNLILHKEAYNSGGFAVHYQPIRRRIKIRVRSATMVATELVSDSIGDPMKWHHIACGFDGARVSIAVDGVVRYGMTSVLSMGSSSGSPSGVGLPGESLSVGGGWTKTQRYWGDIDDLRMYSRALTEPEIRVLAR